MKGRIVLLGDNLKDQDFNWPEFGELGSTPPSIEAARALDAIGSLPGHRVETGDANGAYTQSLLRGTKTWVALPEHRLPTHWRGKCTQPVVPLMLVQYGHADAGGLREEPCEDKHASICFESFAEDGQGGFVHTEANSPIIFDVV